MTQHQFDKEILRLVARAELLRSAKRGDAKLRKVSVVGHWVRKHYVNPHDRLIAPARAR